MATRKSSHQSGTASEFLVLSHLLRLGVEAFISLGNTKAIDIIIKGRKGKSFTVDVKSVRGYSSIPINNVRPAKNHFVVVVIYKGNFHDLKILPDFYIIPSLDVPGIRSVFGEELRLLKKRIRKYKDIWDPLMI